MSALAETLGCLTRVFAAFGVPWYVFGAQAVAVHGAPRSTQDVDVTARIPPALLDAVVDALEAEGFHHRFPEVAGELMRSGAVLPLVHRPSGMDLDLVLARSGLEDLVLSRTSSRMLDGVAVPVISPTDLVVLKVLAGRARDLEDVRSVLAGGAVDLAEARDLLGQLEQALGQSDLLPALEDAVNDVAPGRPRRGGGSGGHGR